MDLYNAQRTNFKPGMPRLAGKPGQQRQVTPRSANRGQASPKPPPAAGMLPPASRPMPGGAKKPGPAGGMPPRPMPPGNGPMPPGKKPMPDRPGGVDARPMPMRPGGKKPGGDMSIMKKMAAFKPGM